MGFFDRFFGRREVPARPLQVDGVLGARAAATALGRADLRMVDAAATALDPSGADFVAAYAQLEDALRTVAAQRRAHLTRHDEPGGRQWIVVHASAVDELVATTHLLAAHLAGGAAAPQPAVSAFAFGRDPERIIYVVYAYARGAFYPVVHTPVLRDADVEADVRDLLEGVVPLEDQHALCDPILGVPIP